MRKVPAGAFDALPPLSRDQILRQLQYVLNQGWVPGVEYARPEETAETFWHWWKLPFFLARSPEEVLEEIEACKEAHPDCVIQVVAHDPKRRAPAHHFVVYVPRRA